MAVFIGATKKNPVRYRIHTEKRRIKYAGTGSDSWFTLEQAKKLVDTKKGEAIYEYDLRTMNPLWEVL
jgi:hypothetical protein